MLDSVGRRIDVLTIRARRHVASRRAWRLDLHKIMSDSRTTWGGPIQSDLVHLSLEQTWSASLSCRVVKLMAGELERWEAVQASLRAPRGHHDFWKNEERRPKSGFYDASWLVQKMMKQMFG